MKLTFSTIKLILVVLGLLIVVLCAYLFKRNLELKKECDRSIRNEQAYRKDLQSYRDVNGKLNYEINLVEDKYSNLSRSSELNYVRYRKVIEDQKIKIKNITGITHVETTIDTTFSKPVFITKRVLKDTCVTLGDSSLYVDICIDSIKISARPVVKNIQDLLQSKKRETINAPYKWWIFRIFQRKQDVYTLKIINSNKHIKVNEAEYKIFVR